MCTPVCVLQNAAAVRNRCGKMRHPSYEDGLLRMLLRSSRPDLIVYLNVYPTRLRVRRSPLPTASSTASEYRHVTSVRDKLRSYTIPAPLLYYEGGWTKADPAVGTSHPKIRVLCICTRSSKDTVQLPSGNEKSDIAWT